LIQNEGNYGGVFDRERSNYGRIYHNADLTPESP
jgi:hypothetical protein